MGDLFHNKVAFPYIDRVFARIAMAPQHTFQILTKRPDRMQEYMTREDVVPGIADNIHWHPEWRKKHNCDVGNIKWPLSNVWVGTTVEDQDNDWRIKHLLDTPAAVRFVSAEPLLGPVDIRTQAPDQYGGSYLGIDWVIVGAETGPKARYMDPKWARDIRDQCQSAGVPFFMKKMSNGEPIPDDLMIREYPDA